MTPQFSAFVVLLVQHPDTFLWKLEMGALKFIFIWAFSNLCHVALRPHICKGLEGSAGTSLQDNFASPVAFQLHHRHLPVVDLAMNLVRTSEEHGPRLELDFGTVSGLQAAEFNLCGKILFAEKAKSSEMDPLFQRVQTTAFLRRCARRHLGRWPCTSHCAENGEQTIKTIKQMAQKITKLTFWSRTVARPMLRTPSDVSPAKCDSV